MVKQRITSLNLVYAFLHNNKLYTKTGVKLVFVYKLTNRRFSYMKLGRTFESCAGQRTVCCGELICA